MRLPILDSLERLERFKPSQQAKRTDYLQWSEYFMSLAFLSAMRSKDPVTQVSNISLPLYGLLKFLNVYRLVPA